MIFGEKEFLNFEGSFIEDFIEIGLDPDFIIFAYDSVLVVGIEIGDTLFEHIGVGGDVIVVIKFKDSMKCLLLRVRLLIRIELCCGLFHC